MKYYLLQKLLAAGLIVSTLAATSSLSYGISSESDNCCESPPAQKKDESNYSGTCIAGGLALVAGGLALIAKSQEHLKKAKEFAAMAKKFKTNQNWNNNILDNSKGLKGHSADNFSEHESNFNKLDIPSCFPIPYDGCDNTSVKYTSGLESGSASSNPNSPGNIGIWSGATAVPFARTGELTGSTSSINSASTLGTMNQAITSAMPELLNLRYGKLQGSPTSVLEGRFDSAALKMADKNLNSGLVLSHSQSQQMGSTLSNLGMKPKDIAASMRDLGQPMLGKAYQTASGLEKYAQAPNQASAATKPSGFTEQSTAARAPSLNDIFRKTVSEWKKKYGNAAQIIKAAVASVEDDLFYNINLRYISFRDTFKDLSMQNTLEFPWDKNEKKHVPREQLGAPSPSSNMPASLNNRKASSLE